MLAAVADVVVVVWVDESVLVTVGAGCCCSVPVADVVDVVDAAAVRFERPLRKLVMLPKVPVARLFSFPLGAISIDCVGVFSAVFDCEVSSYFSLA